MEHDHSHHNMDMTDQKSHIQHKEYSKHKGHSANIFKQKLYISLVLTIPVLALSPIIQNFLGEYNPAYSLLDTKNPISIGSLISQPYYSEIKFQQIQAMNQVKKKYLQIGKEFSKITKRKHEYFEKYQLKL